MLVHQQVTLSRPHITSTQPGSDFSHGGRRAVTVAHRLPRSLTVTASSRASSRAFSLSAHKRYKCAGGWPTGAGMELKGKCPDPCPQGDRQISAVRVTAPSTGPTYNLLTAESWTADAHVGLSPSHSFSLLLHSHLWDLSRAKRPTQVFVSASVLPRERRP